MANLHGHLQDSLKIFLLREDRDQVPNIQQPRLRRLIVQGISCLWPLKPFSFGHVECPETENGILTTTRIMILNAGRIQVIYTKRRQQYLNRLFTKLRIEI